jgi:uncharacterized membrane protein
MILSVQATQEQWQSNTSEKYGGEVAIFLMVSISTINTSIDKTANNQIKFIFSYLCLVLGIFFFINSQNAAKNISKFSWINLN